MKDIECIDEIFASVNLVDKIVNENIEAIESGEMNNLSIDGYTLHFNVNSKGILTTVEYIKD